MDMILKGINIWIKQKIRVYFSNNLYFFVKKLIVVLNKYEQKMMKNVLGVTGFKLYNLNYMFLLDFVYYFVFI